jgi:hypothetical protein
LAVDARKPKSRVVYPYEQNAKPGALRSGVLVCRSRQESAFRKEVPPHSAVLFQEMKMGPLSPGSNEVVV